MEEFGEYLSLAVMSPGQLVLLGDFNYHVDDINDRRASTILQTLSDFGLMCSVQLTAAATSFPVFIDTCLDKPKPTKKLVKYRTTKNISNESLSNSIPAAPQLQVIPHTSDLEDLVDHYNTGLADVLDQLAPLQERIITDHHNCAWFTGELCEAKQRRRATEHKGRKSGLAVHHELFMAARNDVMTLSTQAKATYYTDAVSKHSNNSKHLFRLASTLLDASTDEPFPSMDAPKAAQMFSEFFMSKISDIQPSLPVTEMPLVETQPVMTELQYLSSVGQSDVLSLRPHAATKHCALDPLPSHLV